MEPGIINRHYQTSSPSTMAPHLRNHKRYRTLPSMSRLRFLDHDTSGGISKQNSKPRPYQCMPFDPTANNPHNSLILSLSNIISTTSLSVEFVHKILVIKFSHNCYLHFQIRNTADGMEESSIVISWYIVILILNDNHYICRKIRITYFS